MNIIGLTLFKINVMASPLLLYWTTLLGENTVVKLRSTKLYQSPIALKGLELLSDIKKTR